MSDRHVALLLGVVTSGVTLAALGAQDDSKPDARDFDTPPPNGMIDFDEAGLALEAFVRWDRGLKQLDKNKDGRITKDELDAEEQEIRDQVAEMREEYREEGAVPVWEFNRDYFLRSPFEDTAYGLPSALMLRRTYDANSISDPTPLKKAEAALFSYTRDLDEGEDAWDIRGALMYPIQLGDDDWSGEAGLAALRAMPSVTFDRRIGGGQDVDTLIPRFSFEATFKESLFDLDVLRWTLSYATDFDLRSGVLAGELEWEPVELSLGIGVSRPIFNWPLQYRLRPSLRMQYGDVLSAGDKPGLVKDDTFLRFGSNVRLDLFPIDPAFDRLAFVVEYRHSETVVGDSDSTGLFRAGASWRLDGDGHVTLKLTYRKGQLDLTTDDVEDINLSLGLKF